MVETVPVSNVERRATYLETAPVRAAAEAVLEAVEAEVLEEEAVVDLEEVEEEAE